MSLGLKAAGYEYINIDDTWSNMSRVDGLLSPDTTKWPNGIASVAATIHGLGLKMGSLPSPRLYLFLQGLNGTIMTVPAGEN